MSLQNMTSSFPIREYYYMFMRHKLIIFLSVLVCVIGSIGVSFSMQKVYRAETVMMTEGEQILGPLVTGLAITPSQMSRMRALKEQLLSWPRLTLLVQKLGMDKDVKKDPVKYEAMINNLRDKINFRLKRNGILSLSYEGSNPKKAQEIVQSMADIIVEGTITSTNLQANSAIQFIEEQLDVYRKQLEDSETKLREFNELYSSTLPVATSLNNQLVSLKMELQNLLVTNTERHPRVIQTKDLIERLEAQRDAHYRQAREAGLDVGTENYAKLVSSVPYQEQEMAKLRRDYNINNNLYQQFRQKLETAKLSQTLEDAEKGLRFTILEPARLPLKPFKPNRAMIIIAGVFCGFGVGIGLVLLIELGNTSIKTVDEARKLLDLPILGTIATIKPEELLLGERLKADAGI